MENALIDACIVPEASKAAFLEGARKIQTFIRTLPGFVEGFVYEKADGDSRYNVLTVAVWGTDEAYENARTAVAAELKRQGLNPQQTLQNLNIERTRSTYHRTPY